MRVRNGKVTTTDGPFAETKEQFGGYYVIEARDLNEAIQVAAKIPGARFGCVEVRPIAEDAQTIALGFNSRGRMTLSIRASQTTMRCQRGLFESRR